MKRKIYYKYNPNTLSYERVYPNAKDRFLTILRHLLSGIVIGGGMLFLFVYLFGSPGEKQKMQEIKLWQTQYEILSKRLDNMVGVLQDIEQRDDNLYRVIFHADPIPSAIRNSGIGSSARYANFMKFSNSKLIVETSKKVDFLAKQLFVQSNSFDQIVELSKQQKDRIAHVPSIQPISDKYLRRVASGYGERIDPVYGTKRFHAGMDFASYIGTPIYATGDGTIIFSGWKQGYGKCVEIDHGYGFITLYAHMSAYVVSVGQKVKRGQKIGEVGSTGKSTGPHVHYEVRVNNHPDNPAKYYFMDLTPEEYQKVLQISANHGRVMD